MTLFCMASTQHTYRDSINIEILNNQHIKSGTRLTCKKVEIHQRLQTKSADQKTLSGKLFRQS